VTLLITLVDRRQAILVSDRQLTWPNSNKPPDDTNKALLVWMPMARFLVAFQGLAEVRRQPMAGWIQDAWRRAAAQHCHPVETLDRFAGAASAEVGAHNALTVVGAGFLYHEDAPLPVRWMISNCLSEDALRIVPPSLPFRVFKTQVSRENPRDWFATLDRPDDLGDDCRGIWSELVEMLGDQKPAHALVGKAVSLVRRAALVKGRGIGADAMSMVLPSEGDWSFRYHPAQASATTFSPSIVLCPASWGIAGVTFEAKKRVVGLKGGRGHAPCPCGSGKQYRSCHGLDPHRSANGGHMRIEVVRRDPDGHKD
jgi:hypothetical protein